MNILANNIDLVKFIGDYEDVDKAYYEIECQFGIDANNLNGLLTEIDKYINTLISQQDRFVKVTKLMHEIYLEKNKKYGNSFDKTIDEFGLIAPIIRISDKLRRAKQLVQSDEKNTTDESLKDTLLDLANYTVLFYMYLEKKGVEL